MALRALKGIRELRFVLCQTSPHSDGLRYASSHSRKYIVSNYEAIRESPARVTVRQCENSLPVAIATYAYGIEKTASLKKLNCEQIEKIIGEMDAESEHFARTVKL